LCGKQFLVRTDHGAFKWLLKFKTPEGQLPRWLELLVLVYAMKMLTLFQEDHAVTADTVTVPNKRERALQPQIQK